MNRLFVLSFCIVVFLSALGLSGCDRGVEEVSLPDASVPHVTEEMRESLLGLASDDDAIVRASITSLANTGDLRIEQLMEFYRQGSLYVWEDGGANRRVVLCEETIENDNFDEFAPLHDPLAGPDGTYSIIRKDDEVEAIAGIDVASDQVVVPLEELEEISPGRTERRWATSAKFIVRLYSPDRDARLSGVKKCGNPPELVEAIDHLRELADRDPDAKVRWVAWESILLIELKDEAEETRMAAVEGLGTMKSLRAFPRLEERLTALAEEDGADSPERLEQQLVYKRSISAISAHRRNVGIAGNLFRGLSLGSILILMALGLAITFGLMGVINMAHGELLMIGAYATYEVQSIFASLIERGLLPEAAFGYYYAFALPVAFLSAAFVGYLMEILVVSRLYRRPLESLIATWGIGLILIQSVRIRYGDNIGVTAPEWARGSWEVVQDFNLPWSRLFILCVTALSVAAVYGLMNYTRIGLHMRATMQNRDMASSLGVNTRRIDAITFAFGSGLAGIAGYAVTLIGGVTPDMGQQVYIVDSFLVVVTGGVGEILGVICSGLGIGVLTKFIEPGTGTIWAKIILLIGIVIFIQFRPSGLFAPKGRLADD